MSWHVVKFEREDCVEIIPHKWFIKKSCECFWPPTTYKKEKILRLIENCGDPMTDWEVFPVVLLGTYDNLKTAHYKARKATVTSDLSSNADTLLSTKRRRKRNPKFRCSSSSNSESSDENLYPKLKKNVFPARRSRSFSPTKNKSKENSGPRRSNSEDNYLGKLSKFGSHQREDVIGTPHTSATQHFPLSTPEILDQLTNLESVFDIETNETRNEENASTGLNNDYNINTLQSKAQCQATTSKTTFLNNNANIQGNTSTPPSDHVSNLAAKKSQNQATVCKTSFLSDNDFKKLVIDEMSTLNLKMNRLLEEVSLLVRVQRNQSSFSAYSTNNKVHELNSKFPIKNTEELNKFEEWLEDEELYKLLVIELQRIGGHTFGQTTRKIMYKIISNNVAIGYSWDGAKKKAPFKKLKIAKAILESMKRQYEETSEADIVDVIKGWLVKAKERLLKTKNQENLEVN